MCKVDAGWEEGPCLAENQEQLASGVMAVPIRFDSFATAGIVP